MVRNLTFAVALALGTAVSLPAHALGLGELKTGSALNQPFDAQIALSSVGVDQIDTLRVAIASAEAFDKAGIERPFFLSKLRFVPEFLDDGRAVIRVTSDFAIREPFLNFLLEVNWPNGRLLREYTVLLDPPTTTTQRPPQVEPAPARVAITPPAITTASAPVPVVSGEREYGPVKANETLWGIAQKLRPRGVSMAQMMIALQKANAEAFIGGNINRLRRGQILRVPASAELLALSRAEATRAYQAQQDAWLESRAAQLQKSAERTVAPVVADKPAESSSAAPEVEGGVASATSNDTLRIATPRPEGEGEAGSGADAGQANTDAIAQELLVAREDAESSRQETQTLRGEVDELQQRLQDMQRLLSLKDAQLAQLQSNVIEAQQAADAAEANAPEQLAGQPTSQPTEQPTGQLIEDPIEAAMRAAEAEAQVESSVAETAAESVEQAVAASPVLDPAIAEGGELAAAADAVAEAFSASQRPQPVEAPQAPTQALAQEVATAPSSETPSDPVAGQPVVAEQRPISAGVTPEPTPKIEPAASVTPVVSEAAEPAKPEAPQSPASPAFGDWLSKIDIPSAFAWAKANWSYLAGGLAVLLLVFAGILRRRRPEAVEAEMPSTLVAQGEADSDTSERRAAADSALSDDEEAIETQETVEEVDPVAEADVFIAYGRYRQAEEMLDAALLNEPERQDVQFKLLEVYHATRNKGAFARRVEILRDAGFEQSDPENWLRVMQWGRELDKKNPLYVLPVAAGLAGAAMAEAAADTAPGNQAPIEQIESLGDAEPVDDDLSLLGVDVEADLSDQSALAQPNDLATAEVTPPADNFDDLDFELPDLDLPELSESPESLATDDLTLSVDSPAVDPLAADALAEDAAPLDEVDATALSLEDALAEIGLGDEDALPGAEADEQVAEASAPSEAVLEDAVQVDEPDELDLEADLKALGDADLLADASEMAAKEPVEMSGADVLDDELALDLEADLAAETSASDMTAPETAASGLDAPISLEAAFEQAAEDDALDPMDLDEDDAIVGGSTDADAGLDDEVGTKLDLARAYIEMGDAEGAREILEEVLNEGSSGQQSEADKMLAEIA